MIQWGDTLSIIAEIVGTDVDSLAAANGIGDEDFILVGDLLVNVLDTNASVAIAPAETAKPAETKPEESKPVEETPVTPETPVAKTYTIEHKNGTATHSNEKVLRDENLGYSGDGALLGWNESNRVIDKTDLIKTYTNEKGQTVKEYIVEEKTITKPFGEYAQFDNTMLPGQEVITGKLVNGETHVIYKVTVVDGASAPIEVLKNEYVEEQYPVVTVGTMEHYKTVQVTITTPIIAGKVVTEDPTKSASESYNQEGTNGSKVEVVEISYFNGEETERKVLSSETTPATYGKQLIGTK